MSHSLSKNYLTLHYLGNIKLDHYFKQQFDYFPKKSILTDHLKYILKTSDITCGNFCTNITPSLDTNSKSFCLDPQYINLLKDLHIDYLNLAHYNLLNDKKKQDFLDTLNYLKDLNIKYSGAGINLHDCKKSCHVHKKNIKIGFLSGCTSHDYCSAGVPSCMINNDKGYEGIFYIDLENEDYSDVLQLIKKEKKNVDLLIFSVFWGIHYSNIVRHKMSQKMKSAFVPHSHIVKFTHDAIDAGVDIIIGIGDHILPIEYYKQGIIIYSPGNFIHSNYVNDKKYRHDLGAIIEIKIDTANPSKKKISVIPIKISSEFYYCSGKNIKTNHVQLAKHHDRQFIKNKMFLMKHLF